MQDEGNLRAQKLLGFVQGLNNDEENGWENFKRAVSREQKGANGPKADAADDASEHSKKTETVKGADGEKEADAKPDHSQSKDDKLSTPAAKNSDSDAAVTKSSDDKTGTAAASKGDDDLLNVLKDLQTAIAAKPNDLTLQMQEVRLLLVTNQLDKAKSAFEAIDVRSKDNADVDLLHAEVLLWSKDEQKAREQYDTAIKLAQNASA